jgi:hypothetical protein
MPGIHVFFLEIKAWMAGTSPAMTARLRLHHADQLLELCRVVAQRFA